MARYNIKIKKPTLKLRHLPDEGTDQISDLYQNITTIFNAHRGEELANKVNVTTGRLTRVYTKPLKPEKMEVLKNTVNQMMRELKAGVKPDVIAPAQP